MAATDVMLQEAIEAVRQGQRTRARDLLTRLLKADQANPQYWLWMSAVVDTVKERVYCLETVLRLDPANETARRGLVLAGARQPDPGLAPQPFQRRKWQVEARPEPPQGAARLFASPWVRFGAIGGALLIVIALVLAGVFGFGRRQAAAARPTKTPGPPPTFTSTPTLIGATAVVVRVTPSPTFTGPTPLWMLLESTYTPTPVYVNTPHPITEAFRLGQRAYGRGEWQTARDYFIEASRVDPTAADIYYFIGEAERMLGNPAAALAAYEQSLAANANFAPALLGRVRARLALDPGAEIGEDLDRAIGLDPVYGDLYLERARHRLEQGEIETAIEDLDQAAALLPDAPQLYLYRARAALLQDDPAAALENARRAVELDRTLLEAYLALGQAAAAAGELDTARTALETYLTYAPEDALGWLTLGQVQAGITSVDEVQLSLAQADDSPPDPDALESFEKAAGLNPDLPGLYLLRGWLYLRQGEGQKAVNDLLMARRLDRQSFLVNLGLGRALLVAGRLPEAFDQMSAGEDLAQGDADLAALYFWRAQVADAQGRWPTAVKDYQALLELPEGAAPAAWLEAADAYILALTPTPTPTFTLTPRPSLTPTPTRAVTGKPSASPTATP